MERTADQRDPSYSEKRQSKLAYTRMYQRRQRKLMAKGDPEWCKGCGAMVLMPCMLCRDRAALASIKKAEALL